MEESELEKARKLYLDPTEGFLGPDKFFNKIQRLGINLTRKQVRDMIYSLPTYQINEPVVRKKKHMKQILARAPKWEFQSDLIDLSKYKNYNRGYKYILTVIDIYSRYGWIIPLKSKSGSAVKEALEKVFQEARPLIFTSDNGREFLNQYVKGLLENYRIEQRTNFPNDHYHVGIIESFNRMVKKYLERYTSQKDTFTWFDVVDAISQNYNNTIHSYHKDTPRKVMRRGYYKDYVPTTPRTGQTEGKFNIGDQVRVSKRLSSFERGFRRPFSKSIYKVVGKKGNRYSVENVNSGKTKNMREDELREATGQVQEMQSKEKKRKKAIKGITRFKREYLTEKVLKNRMRHSGPKTRRK